MIGKEKRKKKGKVALEVGVVATCAILFLDGDVERLALGIVELVHGLDVEQEGHAHGQYEGEQQRAGDRHPDAAREEALAVVDLAEHVGRAVGGYIERLDLQSSTIKSLSNSEIQTQAMCIYYT